MNRQRPDQYIAGGVAAQGLHGLDAMEEIGAELASTY